MLPPKLLLFIVAIILLFAYLAWHRSQQQEVQRRRRRLAMFAEAPEPASPALQNQLIQMVGGDWQEAERLVSRARFGHPRRSESYYWYRAIRQLQQLRGEAVSFDDFEAEMNRIGNTTGSNTGDYPDQTMQN
jgi:uncharacterized protein HemY